MDAQVTQPNGTLHYSQMGKGNKVLLLFHGFGQSHSVFHPLMLQLQSEYTCYSFDLFFHGTSQWTKGDSPISKNEWAEFMKSFLATNHITHFSVLGFSMGSRFALVTTEAFPTQINSLYLVAPDGIRTSRWYTFATGTKLIRAYFKSLITKPERFFVLLKGIEKLGLSSKIVMRFATRQMDTRQKRALVYHSWVVFRHLRLPPRHLARIVKQNSIPLELMLAQHDVVVQPKNLAPLLKKLPELQPRIVETHHNGLITACADFFF